MEMFVGLTRTTSIHIHHTRSPAFTLRKPIDFWRVDLPPDTLPVGFDTEDFWKLDKDKVYRSFDTEDFWKLDKDKVYRSS